MEYLYKFDRDSGPSDWKVIDDVVMGGRSKGALRIDKRGYGIFTGHVSLDEGGGFSSVHHPFDTRDVRAFNQIQIRIKGDGNRYQLRVKSNLEDEYSYAASFVSPSEWQDLDIPFSEMHPVYRGKALKMPNYPGEQMEEVAFLIANGKEEDFRLMIDYIGLK